MGYVVVCYATKAGGVMCKDVWKTEIPFEKFDIR